MLNKKAEYNIYQSIEQKTFRSALFHFVKKEYGFTMGNLGIERFCKDVEGLVEKYYPKREYLKAGQMLWYAVAEEEKPSYAKRITETKMVPVILSIVTEEDIEGLKKGAGLREIKKKLPIRLHEEAKEQGGVLSELDTAVIMKMSTGTISRYILNYESETGKVVPRRGTVHDLGRSVTHKRLICHERFIKKHSSVRIARETSHSLEEVEKYLLDCRRVKYCILKGLDEEQISFVLKMSRNLVREYCGIITDLEDRGLEKELENDLLDYKITFDRSSEEVGMHDGVELGK